MKYKLIVSSLSLVILLALSGCGSWTASNRSGTLTSYQRNNANTNLSSTYDGTQKVYPWFSTSKSTATEKSQNPTSATAKNSDYYANRYGRVTAIDQKEVNKNTTKTNSSLRAAARDVGFAARELGNGVTDAIK